MSVSSRFAVAVHILTLLEYMPTEMQSSSLIAGSVNTNPVVIRRILGMLAKAGLVTTENGVDGGTRLAKAAAEITLDAVYQATEQTTLLPMHTTLPNQQCPCGRTIQSVLAPIFADAEAALHGTFAGKTIADVVGEVQWLNPQ